MKRYHFRLETVLRVRRVEEMLARQSLGIANRTIHELEAAEAKVRQRYDNLPEVLPPLEAPMFHARREEAVRLGMALTNAGDAVAAARVEQLQALDLLNIVRKRVSTLEHLDQSARMTWHYEQERDERALLDDFVNSRRQGEGEDLS
jgi:flagellar export protein FliJ